MHVRVRLEHTKHKDRVMEYEMYDINCAEVCAILNGPTPEKRVADYIANKLESKMPQSLYNFDVKDWEFV